MSRCGRGAERHGERRRERESDRSPATPLHAPLVTRLSLLILVTASLAASLSCQESDLAIPPAPVSLGIRGQVQAGGAPIRATVQAERLAPSPGMPDLVSTGITDADGRYSFLLPAGRYLVHVRPPAVWWSNDSWYYRREGGPGRRAQADTVELVEGSGFSTADFPLGRVDLDLTLPADHLGAAADLVLLPIFADHPSGWEDECFVVLAASSYPVHVEVPLPAGRYCVRVRSPRAEGFWLPGVPGIDEADTLVVSAGEATAYQAVFTAGAAVLRLALRGDGYVSGSQETATIVVLDPDSTEVVTVGVRPGEQRDLLTTFRRRVRLLVRDGYEPRFWVGGHDFESAAQYDLIPDSITVVPPITAGAIRFRWIGPEAVGAKRARTLLLSDQGWTLPERLVSWSGDLVTLRMLPPGRYRLRVETTRPGRDTWLPQWFDRAGTAEEAAWIEIPEPGPVVPIELRIENGGGIQGPLQTSASYVSFVVFATRAAEYQACWTSSATSIDGEYFLRGLPDGAFKVGLSRNASLAAGCPVPPSDSRWFGDTASWDSATVITIRDHEVVEGIELHWR